MTTINEANVKFTVGKNADVLLSNDGQTLVVEYDIGASEPVRIGLPFDVAKDLFAKMSFVTSATIADKTSTGGTGFVRMTPVTAADAQVTDIPDHLALTLIDESKIPHYFALPIDLSAQLRPRLRSAEGASKRNSPMGQA